MSQEFLETRVGELEQEQARQGARLERIEADVGKINQGIDKLLDRHSGEPFGWKSIFATCAGLGAFGVVLWFLIGASPAVEALREDSRSLSRRVDKLDDPTVGRVGRIEREFGRWVPDVARGN